MSSVCAPIATAADADGATPLLELRAFMQLDEDEHSELCDGAPAAAALVRHSSALKVARGATFLAQRQRATVATVAAPPDWIDVDWWRAVRTANPDDHIDVTLDGVFSDFLVQLCQTLPPLTHSLEVGLRWPGHVSFQFRDVCAQGGWQWDQKDASLTWKKAVRAADLGRWIPGVSTLCYELHVRVAERERTHCLLSPPAVVRAACSPGTAQP